MNVCEFRKFEKVLMARYVFMTNVMHDRSRDDHLIYQAFH